MSTKTLIAPPVWPIPQLKSENQRDLFEWARLKDPKGNTAHYWIAAFALFLQPLATSTASIGQIILIVYAVLRLHATWRCHLALFRSLTWWLFLGFFAWVLIAMLWSSNTELGWGTVKQARFILFALALWPVLDRPLFYLVPLGAAVALQTCVQIFVYFDIPLVIDVHNAGKMNGGLSKHPGNSLIWTSVVGCLLLGVFQQNVYQKLYIGIALILCAIGLTISGSRTLWFAAPFCWFFAVLYTYINRPTTDTSHNLKPTISILLVCMGCACGIFMADERIKERSLAVLTNTTQAIDNEEYDSSAGKRIIWFKAGLKTWTHKPIIGFGTGATRQALEQTQTMNGIQFDEQTQTMNGIQFDTEQTENTHSSITHALIEGGIISLILLVGIGVSMFVGACKRCFNSSILVGLPAAVLCLGIYGVANTLQTTGFLISLTSTLLILSISRPLPEDPQAKN